MPKKSKTNTTEILAAIITVLFIFSLIGIIGFKPHAAPPIPAQQSTPPPAAAPQSPPPAVVTTPTGTTLSSASSDFQVMPK